MKLIRSALPLTLLLTIAAGLSSCHVRSAIDPELSAKDLAFEFDGQPHEVIPQYKGSGTINISYSGSQSHESELPFYPGVYTAYINFTGDEYTYDRITTATITIKSPLREEFYSTTETLYYPRFMDGRETSLYERTLPHNNSIKKIIFGNEFSAENIFSISSNSNFSNIVNLETIVIPNNALNYDLFIQPYNFVNLADNKLLNIIEKDALYNTKKLREKSEHFILVSHYNSHIKLDENDISIFDKDLIQLQPETSGEYFIPRGAYKILLRKSIENLNLNNDVIDLTKGQMSIPSIKLAKSMRISYRIKGKIGDAFNVEMTPIRGEIQPYIFIADDFIPSSNLSPSINDEDFDQFVHFISTDEMFITLINRQEAEVEWQLNFVQPKEIVSEIHDGILNIKVGSKKLYSYSALVDGELRLDLVSFDDFAFRLVHTPEGSSSTVFNKKVLYYMPILANKVIFFGVIVESSGETAATSADFSASTYEIQKTITWYADGKMVEGNILEIHTGQEIQLSFDAGGLNTNNRIQFLLPTPGFSSSENGKIKATEPNYSSSLKAYAQTSVGFSLRDGLCIVQVPDEPEFIPALNGFMFRLKTDFVNTENCKLFFNFGFSINDDKKIWNMLVSDFQITAKYGINEWQYFDIRSIIEKLGLQDNVHVTLNFKKMQCRIVDNDGGFSINSQINSSIIVNI